MGIAGPEITLRLVGTRKIVESQYICRGDIASLDIVAPVAVFLCLLNQGHGEVMFLVECLIPGKGIVQRVIEVLCRLAVGSTGSRVAVWKLSRQEVAVEMPLEAWSNIERIAETEWQGYLGIKDGIQNGLTLLQVDILLVEVIVVTTIGWVAATWILHLIAILVITGSIWRLTQLVVIPIVTSQWHWARLIRTVLEVYVGTYFQPIGNLGIDLHVRTECMVVITLDGTLIVQIAEAQIIVHLVGSTRDAGIVILVETSAEGGILPIV